MNYREVSREANRTRTAVESANWDVLRYCGNRFERGQYYKEAWKALAVGVEGKTGLDGPVWPGPYFPCRHLLVLQRSRDLGDELRTIRFVSPAAQAADKVTALVEPRLIPLLSRSFPKVQFIHRDSAIKDITYSHIAAQERLAYWFGHDSEAIEKSFEPLQALPMQTVKRGIGIAWYSRAIGKTLPSLQDWGTVLRDWTIQLQSLQYREQNAGLKKLSELAGRPIKSSRHVDQIADLDAFAAQVSGLRGVLTISNTTAHMAGALGIPCVVILDNGIVTTWPYTNFSTPFYPKTRLIRRRNDSWLTALNKGRKVLTSMINKQENSVS